VARRLIRLAATAPRHSARIFLAVGLVVLLTALGAGGRTLPAAAQLAGGTNLTLTPSTTSPQAGETVTFNYRASPPAVAPPFASITSLMLDFGDGTTADLSSDYAAGETVTGSTTHAYTSPGSYTAVLTASASNGGSGHATAQLTVSGSGGGSLPGQGINVPYQPGWNLVAVPLNTTIPGPLGPMYTYQAGDTAYEMVQNTQPGLGYWVFFNAPTTATLVAGSPQSVSLPIPAGQWVMVGNPGSFPATVRGADVVFVYNPSSGYQATTTLQPGQGAWVFSNSSGTVTIAN
jgi:PKD repeat protein